jgi:hypothetical protein
MVKSEKEAKRTTRRSLWRELLWRKPIVFLAIAITFASTADWLWDEVVEPFFHVQRPKLLDLLRWLPWYEWVIIGLILMVILVGEHAFKLINQAESESIQHAKGRQNTEDELLALRTTHGEELAKVANNPWLQALNKRQRLQSELQELEKEELGIKVESAITFGKDESEYRKETIDRLKRDILETSNLMDLLLHKQQEELQRNRHSKSLDWGGEWKLAGDGFRVHYRSDIFAQWQHESPSNITTWLLRGGDLFTRADVEAVCSRAGALLISCPGFDAVVTQEVKNIKSDWQRWLEYLREKHPMSNVASGSTYDADDKVAGHIQIGDIHHVAAVSASECVKCAAIALSSKQLW